MHTLGLVVVVVVVVDVVVVVVEGEVLVVVVVIVVVVVVVEVVVVETTSLVCSVVQIKIFTSADFSSRSLYTATPEKMKTRNQIAIRNPVLRIVN